MPVFHTKIIASILEPVAQQVSELVILHEEAEDGNAMPDLTAPVRAVSSAVINLVKVGRETCETATDKILKQEMPPALTRVEEAANLLVVACELLKQDPFSSQARKKLIEGARGILGGTSALLLAFDQHEVRKILRVCKGVLEILAVAEVVESMGDCVTFVKNLTPGMTGLATMINSREKELTYEVHRELLKTHMANVKSLTPVLISGIKIFITTQGMGGKGQREAQENRNFVVSKMSREIHELMRVLQLTTYDEDDWNTDDLTVMRKAMSNIAQSMQPGMDWLSNPHAEAGGLGEKAVRQILEDAKRIADRMEPGPYQAAILKSITDIQTMLDELADLRSKGQGNSPRALELANAIQAHLRNLEQQVGQAVSMAVRSGITRPAYTLAGKVEQAQRWLNNPSFDDKGLGQRAIAGIVAQGRKVARSLKEPERGDMLRLCDEVETLSQNLAQQCQRGLGDSPQGQAVAKRLAEKLSLLQGKIESAITSQVADNFMDPYTPIKELEIAAKAPLGTPNRDANYTAKSRNFIEHNTKLADIAQRLGEAGGCKDKRVVEEMNATSNQLRELAPQVVSAGQILMYNPDNEVAREHFELLKEEWTKGMHKLTGLVDQATDTVKFIEATEAGMKRDGAMVAQAIHDRNPAGIVAGAGNIARRADRVIQVANQEADNSEDPQFVQNVKAATERVKLNVSPMIASAKDVCMNPTDLDAQHRWHSAEGGMVKSVGDLKIPFLVTIPLEQMSPPPVPPPPAPFHETDAAQSYRPAPRAPQRQKVMDSVGGVREAILLSQAPPPPPPPVEDMSHMSLQESAPPRPPLPSDQMPPPRPPPPEEEEEIQMIKPSADQPIATAAYELHLEAQKWSSKGNELIRAAKKMALLMAEMSKHVRGEGGSKKDLIDCAKAIAKASQEVTKHARDIAQKCTDRRIKLNLLQVCERIPTIATQLKILTTVKATMLGAQGSDEDQEATEMLVGNAQNLMQAVKETVRASEAASIKIRTDVAGVRVRWVRQNPWYS